MFRSGFSTLMSSDAEMNNIMKQVKYLEESVLLMKGVRGRIENEAKRPKGGILGMLLGTLGASLLGNLITD